MRIEMWIPANEITEKTFKDGIYVLVRRDNSSDRKELDEFFVGKYSWDLFMSGYPWAYSKESITHIMEIPKI
ncbi:hypothetical protein M0R36_10790 [bacterium]|nr:hypothetical protein [bacterium]